MRWRRAALLAALAASPASASAPAGQWAIVPSPNSPPAATQNFLAGTTCVAAADCWAVGYYNAAPGVTHTLVERWDGTAWSRVPSPNAGTLQSNVLRGVTCVSATDCWAVGYHDDDGIHQALALHWDGSAWSRVPAANTSAAQYNYLLGVSCASATSCVAVGYSTGSQHQTLIQRWDGTAWSIVASPNTSAAQPNLLHDVECVAASDCWAVGSAVDALTGFERTLIQRWNGSAWSVVTSPNALVSTNNALQAVTCVAASDCWAVGSAFNGSAQQTLVARWNGTSWATVTSPNTSTGEANALAAVTCAAAGDCWAVGSAGAVAQTLVTRWNGTAWAIVASPSPGALGSVLRGVACAGGGCNATGHANAAGTEQALALRWSGTAWAVAAAGNATTARSNTLLGVACAGAADCWSVASHDSGGVQQTLIERWNGATWSIVPSPNTSAAEGNILYDVKCPAADDCWAIGYRFAPAAVQTLALRWDGSAWGIVASPNTSPLENNFFVSLHCSSTSDCWAAGYSNDGGYHALLAHWDGTAWALASAPNTDVTRENRLNGVSCAAANDCWAVGHHFTGTAYETLAEHWDGSAWTIVPSPNGPTPDSRLSHVACVSASDCWAVGRTWDGTVQQTLIAHWDGAGWSVVASPNTSATLYNYLNRVTCASASSCWATGAHFADGYFRTLLLHWDGTAWSIVASPNATATQANYLVGVACVSALECWAVGQYVDAGAAYQTLIARYLAPDRPQPDPFTFAERTGVATRVHVTSEARTLQGLGGAWPIVVDSGGQYRVNAGAWTGAAGQVGAGDAISVRHLSASTPNAATETLLTIGTTDVTFRSVTAAQDRTPDAIAFAAQAGVAPAQAVASEIVLPTGFDVAIPVVPGSGLSYRIAGGAWTGASGTLLPGQSLQVRHTSSATSLGYTRTSLKVGGVVAYFTTRTR
jgi:hypothetical protein